MSVRRILGWSLLFVLLVPLIVLAGIAGLNYNGYCFSQSRFIPDHERTKSGIEAVVQNYALIRFVPDEMPSVGKPAPTQRDFRGSNPKGVEVSNDQLVPYRDVDELRALNPDCCTFGRRGLYADVGDTPFLMKITGDSAGFFNARYQVRYRDAAGRIQSRWTGTTYHYTNCGRSNLPY